MIVFTTRDNRFTRFVERNGHRLAGATVCRVRGHRHSRYIWGACDRCFQFYRGPEVLAAMKILGEGEWCHCGKEVDTSELRNRGMCTHCDDVRCDAYPGECGR